MPHTSDDMQAERVLHSIAVFVGTTVPERRKRIRKLTYSHSGKEFSVEVGKPAPSYYEEGEQPVIAILGHDPLYICLPTRGVAGGGPILVGAGSVFSIEYFDLLGA